MMKRWMALMCAVVLAACVLVPRASFTEDRDTVQLARVLYALAREESYETQLAIGAVAMNRVRSAWFPGTLSEVLSQQHQFPMGKRYDERSLSAAHAVIAGQATLPADALYYHSLDASEPWSETPVKTVGRYAFYTREGGY